MTERKQIHFTVPEAIHAELIRIFPGKGERAAFFKEMAYLALELGPESRIVSRIRRMVKAEEEGLPFEEE